MKSKYTRESQQYGYEAGNSNDQRTVSRILQEQNNPMPVPKSALKTSSAYKAQQVVPSNQYPRSRTRNTAIQRPDSAEARSPSPMDALCT